MKLTEGEELKGEAAEIVRDIAAIRAALVSGKPGSERVARSLLLALDAKARAHLNKTAAYVNNNKTNQARAVEAAVAAEARRQEIAHYVHPEDRPGI